MFGKLKSNHKEADAWIVEVLPVQRYMDLEEYNTDDTDWTRILM